MALDSGYWKPITSGEDLYECSICGKWQYIPEENFKFCPECGNPMDGERKDNEG